VKYIIGVVGIFFVVLLLAHYCHGRDKVRHAILAGSWYPGTKEELSRTVASYIKHAQPQTPQGRLYALISPHAGYRFSGQAAGFGYKLLQGNDNIRRVIILAPSHHLGFRGLSVLDVDSYETPLGLVEVDQEAGVLLREHPMIDSIPSAHSREHSLEIQLPFLQETLKKFKLVPVVVGQLSGNDYEILADALRPLIDENTLVIASSDFTHFGASFGYMPFKSDIKENLAKLDGKAVDNIISKNFEGFRKYLSQTGATICGKDGISILLKLLPPQAEGTKLVYYTSGDVTGDFTSSVSYASIAFTVPHDLSSPLSPEKQADQ
jgi:AmmeMemoRadiSam system protein B